MKGKALRSSTFQYPISTLLKLKSLCPLIDQMYHVCINNTDKNLLVHCKGGMGRTGMVIACLARKVFNYSPEEATSWVRKTLPGAIEVQSQLDAIKNLIPTYVALPPAPPSAPQLQQNTQQVSLAPKLEQKRRSNLFTSILDLIICCKKSKKSNTARRGCLESIF